jgi:uncharacterized membrane protein YcgQ (UPF0703/DUF1980 family)
MRKFFGVLCLAVGLTLPFSVPSEGAQGDLKIFEIKEKMFVAQTNDVYINREEYLGRTIKLEGMFGVVEDEEDPCYYVYRYGPGCCAFDATAGFEVRWGAAYPSPDEWVEAVGVLESYEYDGEEYLRLALSSLTVKAERGLETVEQ